LLNRHVQIPCGGLEHYGKLAKEKEVVGIYISGHPLDDYKFEMKYFCNAKLEALRSLEHQAEFDLWWNYK
jgi:DNA polymerase-3 subunit alpha